MVSEIDVNQVIATMRRMSIMAQGMQSPVESQPAGTSFGNLLESAMGSVNQVQQRASGMAKAFELGDPRVNLSDVMVETQKASVSFQAMVQVRNKLLAAYQDVMNMQV